MLRKLALLLLPVALLAAACGGGGYKTSTKTSTPGSDRTTVARTKTPAATAGRTPGVRGSGGSAASALFDTVNPFQLLGDVGGAPSSADVDPKLKSVLLDSGDLPSGFTAAGDFAYEVPSQYGALQLALNIFSSGDASSQQFGGMIMSAAIALTPDALNAIESHGGIEQLQSIKDADLQDLTGAAEQFGVGVTDMHVLDGSGLGDGGVGIHMVIDFSGLLEAFGAQGDNPFGSGLAIDVYMFLRGDHMLMTMVMAPADQSSGIDSHALADALDANASGVF